MLYVAALDLNSVMIILVLGKEIWRLNHFQLDRIGCAERPTQVEKWKESSVEDKFTASMGKNS
jgi:hypothetical protein